MGAEYPRAYRRAAAVISIAAVGVLLRAQTPTPIDPAVQIATATVLFEQGRFLDALQAFDLAAETDDPALALRARKGKVRAALRVAEFATAREEAERIVSAGGDSDAEALALYGDALWAAGLFDEAEASYAASVARSPDSSRGRFGVARSLATRNRLDAALQETLAALALAPRDADLHALVASIYEGLRRFGEAAAEYDAYANLLSAAETTPLATARARAVFLRSFADRPPLDVSASQSRSTTVSFKLVRNKVVLPGRINGARVDWVLDTGAERTGISHDAAQRAGVRPLTTTLTAGVGQPRLRRVQLARVDNLEVGSLKIRNVPVSVRDPARGGSPRWQGESLSPISLGLSVIVDYPRRRVTLARELERTDADITLPLRVQRVPLVRGLLNARHPALFVVDTGGEVISISSETAQSLGMSPARRIPLRVFGLSGTDESAFLLPGVDLDFDDLEYRKIGLAVLNLRAPSVLLGFQVGGIVGHKMLGDYRVTMDLARSQLRLERN